MNYFYKFTEYDSTCPIETEVLILAENSDERAMSFAKGLSNSAINPGEVIVIKYIQQDVSYINALFPKSKVLTLQGGVDQFDFLRELKRYEKLLSKVVKITIDMSCIHIPELFVVIKYLQHLIPSCSLKVVYSMPFEYEFPAEPFTSFRSYYGNLRTINLIGYGGISDGSAHSHMVVFMGFEGMLSAKIVEDIRYDELILVNSLPSFYPKYKDVSVISNYDLLDTQPQRIQYAPANNPFETFNLLDKLLKDKDCPCVAPLSTKPVALGVCLYALFHENMRVVYPVSDEYIPHVANKVLRTYIYDIPLLLPEL